MRTIALLLDSLGSQVKLLLYSLMGGLQYYTMFAQSTDMVSGLAHLQLEFFRSGQLVPSCSLQDKMEC